ncbi:hypothetical protein TWF481_005006 [Arthrobotrys musiformis]|uniref:Fucose-specific lectin n=1 Tax=Arthrobotrys musiformis TaxID=47236 RepID=A0AAV9WL82_9PEZI
MASASNPVTSVINPFNLKETLLYYITPKRQLALERWPLDPGSASNRRLHNDNGTLNGRFAAPGVLATVVRQGVITVYGFLPVDQVDTVSTDESGATAQVNYVAQLSPIVNPVKAGEDMQTSLFGLAAADDGNTTTWIYFTKLPAPGQDPIIYESTINVDSAEVNPLNRDLQPLANSKLAVIKYPDSDDRVLFYQDNDNDNKIYAYFPSRDEESSRTLNRSAAFPGTPLAVTISGSGDNVVTYVYFVDPSKDLVCSIKRGGIDGKWEAPILVPKSKKVNVNSQLTVTTDSKHNHIFYIETGGRSYTELVHTLVK